jgi:hypothetical protein
MLSQWWKRAAGSLAAACIVVLAGSLAQAQRQVDWQSIVQPQARWVVQAATAAEPVQLGSHWIGVLCRPADEVLRSHLKLDHGLVVDRVVPTSPAAKAGIQQHDVLLSFGGHELKTVIELVDAVKAADGGETEIKLIREGQGLSIKVTPAKRPGEGFDPLDGSRFDRDSIRKWIEQNLPKELDPEKMPFRKYRFGPGMIVPDTLRMTTKLPENLSVTITRKGDAKAEITVKRDGETWTATEDDLEPLPEDVRPHVKRLLGRGVTFEFDIDAANRWREHLKELPQFKQPRKPAPVPRIEVRPGRPAEEMQKLERRMREQLEKLQQSLERMQRELDAVREEAESGQSDDVEVEVEIVPDKPAKKSSPKKT